MMTKSRTGGVVIRGAAWITILSMLLQPVAAVAGTFNSVQNGAHDGAPTTPRDGGTITIGGGMLPRGANMTLGSGGGGAIGKGARNGDGQQTYAKRTGLQSSGQPPEIIFISKAFQLDANQNIVADRYDTVSTHDGVYTSVPSGNYVRVTFDTILNNTRDITLYAKATNANTPVRVRVFPVYVDQDGNRKQGPELATTSDGENPDFSNIGQDNKYHVLLTRLTTPTDTFDLKVTGGDMAIDYIVDPLSVVCSDTFNRANNDALGTMDNLLGGIITPAWYSVELQPANHSILNNSAQLIAKLHLTNRDYPDSCIDHNFSFAELGPKFVIEFDLAMSTAANTAWLSLMVGVRKSDLCVNDPGSNPHLINTTMQNSSIPSDATPVGILFRCDNNIVVWNNKSNGGGAASMSTLTTATHRMRVEIDSDSGFGVGVNATMRLFIDGVKFTNLRNQSLSAYTFPWSNGNMYIAFETQDTNAKSVDNLVILHGSDYTPDWVSGWPKVDTATSVGFTVRAEANEVGKAYYVVVANGATPAPTAAQVKAGNDGNNSPALKSGPIVLTAANTEYTAVVNGLSENTDYDVYMVAEDGLSTPNLQTSTVTKQIKTLNATGTVLKFR